MSNDDPISYIFPVAKDLGLFDYTISIANDALNRALDELDKQNRAERSLNFCMALLDPSIHAEKQQLETFQIYRAALDDPKMVNRLLDSDHIKDRVSASLPVQKPRHDFSATAMHQVISLPDTLDTIFSFLAVRKRTDRSDLCNAALVSHAFYNAATPLLWQSPRRLDTIRKQLLFAFGASISGKGVGRHVQRLSINIFKGCWNIKLLIKIAGLTPNVTDLAIYWGNSMDGEEIVTTESVVSVNQILLTFSKLERLDLAKYSYTPPRERILIPVDAHKPFTQLKGLSLYRFHWLWEPILQGIGSKLEDLDIGFGTHLESHKLVKISAKVPFLKSLHISVLDVDDLGFAFTNIPQLEHFYVNNFSYVDNTSSEKLIQHLLTMRCLRTIHIVNCMVKGEQLELLANSSLALENLTLELIGDDSVPQAILKFLRDKRKTLKRISLGFCDGYKLKASNDIAYALAEIPNLEYVDIDMDLSGDRPSAASIDALLNNCPNLLLTDQLRNLADGNSLFNEKYLPKLKSIEDEMYEELSDFSFKLKFHHTSSHPCPWNFVPMSDWTTDANEALTLSLVRSATDKEVLAEDETYEEFHPTFTYPIYGEDEKIYGYKDIVIDLRFTSGSLKQYLNITYAKKLPSTSTVDDVEATLSGFIPPGYFTDKDAFLKAVDNDANAFRPPGQLVYSYTRPSPSSSSKGKRKRSGNNQALDPQSEDVIEYEVYHSTWDTPGFREYHRRMQLFILLYIEGGSYINEDEDTWEFVLLFEKRKRRDTSHTSAYHFVGYSSLYPFYYFPEKVRLRLSQFVILPPYQRHGHGSELYKAIYQYILKNPVIAELTVEDPAEAFEDLRDKNDLEMLLSNERFIEEAFGAQDSVGGTRRARKSLHGGEHGLEKGKLIPPADKVWSEKWRKDLKIAGRQFQRVTEMLALLHLDPQDQNIMRAYRLQVKERLYRFNFEILAQLEKEERHEKLEETFQSVRDDYHRILALVT
uniref:Histone acetyltransferase type B catalytic subunit n=1 Tax=Psilocybe cubensis TaxID=181762 RepID=A0A8H7Y2N6_PSICU